MGIELEIAIYAILKTDSTNHETIFVFLFEKDDDTGLMHHEYISQAMSGNEAEESYRAVDCENPLR